MRIDPLSLTCGLSQDRAFSDRVTRYRSWFLPLYRGTITRFSSYLISDQSRSHSVATRIPQKKDNVRNGITSEGTARKSFSVSAAESTEISPLSSLDRSRNFLILVTGFAAV